MCNCSAKIKAIDLMIGQIGSPQKLLGSSENGYTFAYAPSIIKVGDIWHKYYCSSGTGDTAWDILRHSTSKDLITWTLPNQVLVPSDPINERSCCDPSIVKFNAGDGDFYYLFYSGNKLNVQTVNFVSRSSSPFGPFAKYTERGTWQVNALDPKVIQYPFHAAPDGSDFYGLGQPAVVVNGNLLFMWFTDNTAKYPSEYTGLVYMSTSTDAVNWQRPIPTGVSSWSIDVKYDADNSQFVMFSGEEHHGKFPKMMSRVSDDGVHWSEPKDLFSMPSYSNNVGVSGGERGELEVGKMLFAYGAPKNLANNISWANWDLYGQLLGSEVSTSTYKKLKSAIATESISVFPASNVTDEDGNTFYSSFPFSSKVVSRPAYLAGWFENGKSAISKILLKARMHNSAAMCFPEKYTLHVTSPDNASWVSLGEFTNQPNSNGEVTINIIQRECYGILITPTIVSADIYGNNYFQLAGVSAA
jgi:Glycosyl hydrolases family 32 N-terminal domain